MTEWLQTSNWRTLYLAKGLYYGIYSRLWRRAHHDDFDGEFYPEKRDVDYLIASSSHGIEVEILR
jgi:hypothetical protein